MKKSIHTPEQTVLLDLLRQLRREAGLSQSEMAQRLDVPQSFVSKYESGERRLDILEMRIICDTLGTTLSDFIELLEKKLCETGSSL